MSDLSWTCLLVVQSICCYLLGYSFGKLAEIRERMRQRQEWFDMTIKMSRDHENFIREIAKHFRIELPPRLKVVPPPEDELN